MVFLSLVCRDADVLFSDPAPAFCRSTMGVIMHRLVDLGPWSFCRLVCAALHFVGMFVVWNVPPGLAEGNCPAVVATSR